MEANCFPSSLAKSLTNTGSGGPGAPGKVSFGPVPGASRGPTSLTVCHVREAVGSPAAGGPSPARTQPLCRQDNRGGVGAGAMGGRASCPLSCVQALHWQSPVFLGTALLAWLGEPGHGTLALASDSKGIGVPRWGCPGRGACLHFCGPHSSTSHPISTGTGLGSRVSLVLRYQDTASSLACSAGESLLSFSAWVLLQEAPDPGQGSSCLDSFDNLDVLRTRHAWHARKRRRLV